MANPSLRHDFSAGSLPVGTTRRLEGFSDSTEINGGYASASGVISAAELAAHPGSYALGAKWLVWDTISGKYIWGGDLRDPTEQDDGSVTLAADGWAKSADADAGTFLVLSYNMDQWGPGDAEPFDYRGSDKFHAHLGGGRIVFRVKRHTHFKKNQAGEPAKWFNGFYRWVPGVDIHYVAFKLQKQRSDVNYSIELVGAVGPAGSLSVLATWSLGPGGPADGATVSQVIGDGYDLVGLRIVRTIEAKHARARQFILGDIRIGSVATSDVFTLNNMFVALFTRMGCASSDVSASSVSAVPFESDSGTWAQIADEVALLDNWFWRIEVGAGGSKVGVAGPIGRYSYTVDRPHSPAVTWPEERFSHVRVNYLGAGGLTFTKLLEGAGNPYPPGVKHVYNLDLNNPPHETFATKFAQAIADYLAMERRSGTASFTYVGANHGTIVLPGDSLNVDGFSIPVSKVNHDPDGSVTHAELATGHPMLDKWIAERNQLLNKGFGPDAATAPFIDVDDPKPPVLNTLYFTEVVMRNGKRNYDMVVEHDQVTEDIFGQGTWVRVYLYKYRPVTVSGTPIVHAKGGGWRHKRKKNIDDGEDDVTDEPTRMIITNIPHPNIWYWELWLGCTDGVGNDSLWYKHPTFVRPADFGPPDPVGVSMDVDEHRVELSQVLPPHNAADTNLGDVNESLPTQRIAYSQYIFDDDAAFGGWLANPSGTKPLKHDLHHKAESKTWRLHKPAKDQLYYGAIRNVDHHGNCSAWVTISGSKMLPPTAGIVGVTADTKGTRHNRLRLMAEITPVDESGPDVHDHVAHYTTDWVIKDTHVAPTAPEKKNAIERRAQGSKLNPVAVLMNVRPDQYVYVAVTTINTKGQESPQSSFFDAGQAKSLSGSTEVPIALTNLVAIISKMRIGLSWKVPVVTGGNSPDNSIAHIQFQVSKSSGFGTTVVDNIVGPGHGHFRYAPPRVDRHTEHFIRIRPISGSDSVGAWQPSASGLSVTPGDEDDEEPGVIKKLAHGHIPNGWLLCNGDSYSTSLYVDLFGEIAYTYGGGDSSFNVPDFRHRGPRGVGTAAALATTEGDPVETDRNDGEHGQHKDHRHRHKHRHKHHHRHRHRHHHKHRHKHNHHHDAHGAHLLNAAIEAHNVHGNSGNLSTHGVHDVHQGISASGGGSHIHNAGTLVTADPGTLVPRGTAATDAAGPGHHHVITGDVGTTGSQHVHDAGTNEINSVSGASLGEGHGRHGDHTGHGSHNDHPQHTNHGAHGSHGDHSDDATDSSSIAGSTEYDDADVTDASAITGSTEYDDADATDSSNITGSTETDGPDAAGPDNGSGVAVTIDSVDANTGRGHHRHGRLHVHFIIKT